MKGVEPSYSAWKAAALPLCYTRTFKTKRANARHLKSGGKGWIRTTVLRRGQIYSLLPLTTRPPFHEIGKNQTSKDTLHESFVAVKYFFINLTNLYFYVILLNNFTRFGSLMTDSNPLIHKLLCKDSKNAIVFISGLGLDIKLQREVFIRRFANRYNAGYLALDSTKRAQSDIPFASLVQEAVQVIEKNFSKKNLFFTGACFGANIAMRLANHFNEQTKAVLIMSPAINYSNPSITKTIRSRIERKKQACQKMGLKEQLQQLLIFQQLIEKVLPLADYQEQKYIGEIKILHPQKDNFISLKNSLNMLHALKRENVSLQVLANETHTLKNDNNLKLPILILEEIFQKYREE